MIMIIIDYGYIVEKEKEVTKRLEKWTEMYVKSNNDTFYYLFIFYLHGSKLSKYFCRQQKLTTSVSRMLSISGLEYAMHTI